MGGKAVGAKRKPALAGRVGMLIYLFGNNTLSVFIIYHIALFVIHQDGIDINSIFIYQAYYIFAP